MSGNHPKSWKEAYVLLAAHLRAREEWARASDPEDSERAMVFDWIASDLEYLLEGTNEERSRMFDRWRRDLEQQYEKRPDGALAIPGGAR